MTTGMNAPLDRMHDVAGQWGGLSTDLQPGDIAPTDVDWPSKQGMSELLSALHGYRGKLSVRMGANGATLTNSANTLAGADKQNAGKLGNGSVGEAVKLGEMGQFLGPFIQGAVQGLSAGISSLSQLGSAAIGTVSGLAQAAEGPLTGVVGAVSSANIQHPTNHNTGNPDVGPSSPGDLNEHVTPPPVTPIHPLPIQTRAR